MNINAQVSPSQLGETSKKYSTNHKVKETKENQLKGNNEKLLALIGGNGFDVTSMVITETLFVRLLFQQLGPLSTRPREDKILAFETNLIFKS